jgi:hypothetical protein
VVLSFDEQPMNDCGFDFIALSQEEICSDFLSDDLLNYPLRIIVLPWYRKTKKCPK